MTMTQAWDKQWYEPGADSQRLNQRELLALVGTEGNAMSEWTAIAPAWTEAQGYNEDGTPKLTMEQQAVALMSCIQDGNTEDARNHCKELLTRLKGFNPDWSELEATQQSLRDHMALVRAAQESEQRFRAEVAAALRELQSVWQRRMSSAEDGVMESTLRDVLDELNTTVAKLGLEGR